MRTLRPKIKTTIAKPDTAEEKEEEEGTGGDCSSNISISSESSGKDTIGSMSRTFSGLSFNRSENGESSSTSTGMSVSGSSDRATSVRKWRKRNLAVAPSEHRHPGVEESTPSYNSSSNASDFYRSMSIDDEYYDVQPSPQNRPFGQPLFQHRSPGYHCKHHVDGGEKMRRMKMKTGEESLKRYCMPVLGGVNMVFCNHCCTVVQIPQTLRFSRTPGSSFKLRCGNTRCEKIISFFVYDGMHIVPLKPN